MNITKEFFGYTKDNKAVSLYKLKNSSGAYIELLDYGCRIRSICVPDKNGCLQDVCLGYKTLSEYENDDAYFGACVGRNVNLIYNAQFSLNGKLYKLDKNNGEHNHHGGKNGFSFSLWNGELSDNKVIFTRTVPDMSDGFPGNLNMQITYEWTEDNQLSISYEGISDKDTILSVTNHTYFNLNGGAHPSILNHKLCIDAEEITELNTDLISTGEFLSVNNTPFDFRNFETITKGINSKHYQIVYGDGYDHNFVLNNSGYRKAAELFSPDTNICMTCYTDQPGLQIYTANDLPKRNGRYGETLLDRSGICLETQHYVNSINIPHFPSIVLKANEKFYSKTTFAFSVLE